MHVTRDKGMLLLFTGGTVLGACGIAGGFQSLTGKSSERVRAELEELQQRDVEVRRYAEHSQRALQAIFDSVRKDNAESDIRDANAGSKSLTERPPIKLPQVAWHPNAIARDEKEASDGSKSR